MIGEVTETSAIILVEVDSKSPEGILTCHLYESSEEMTEPVQVLEKDLIIRRPMTFSFEDLSPGTSYTAVIVGTLGMSSAKFKTKAENSDSFKLIALSCDRPQRLLLGQLNPWESILKTVRTGRVDVVLHTGDQVLDRSSFTENCGDEYTYFRFILMAKTLPMQLKYSKNFTTTCRTSNSLI